MASVTEQAQLTSLLSNQLLARVEQLRMNNLAHFTNHTRGERKASGAGSSIEFRDYRDYVPGDDTRFVDWNIFARLHRPYVKLYHEEEQMHVVILLDASASMDFDEKLDRAKQLAAAFAVMGLMATERVSVHAFNVRGEGTIKLPPKRGKNSMREVFAFLESIEAGGSQPLEEGIEMMMRTHRGRGACVLLSDFMTTGNLNGPLNKLYGAGLELFGVQVLSPGEIDPTLNSDLRLVDSESNDTLDVTVSGDLLNIYFDYRDRFIGRIGQLCRMRGGRFDTVSTADSAQHILLDALRRKGWVR